MKICKIQSPDLLFLVVFILLTFTSADIFQDFRHKFSFFNVFSQPFPSPCDTPTLTAKIR